MANNALTFVNSIGSGVKITTTYIVDSDYDRHGVLESKVKREEDCKFAAKLGALSPFYDH
jgi:hypothetical protein